MLYSVTSVIMSWYIGGLILLLIGFFIFKSDGDILTGFLWVLDLGLGLVFFLFILYLLNFLQSKVEFLVNFKTLYYLIALVFPVMVTVSFNKTTINLYNLTQSWSFHVSYYDYYLFFLSALKSDLNLLKECYYVSSSFEFFIINYVILFAIFLIIILFFFIKNLSLLSSLFTLLNVNFMVKNNFFLFLKSQKYIKQFSTTCGVRVWSKFKTS
jgi:hypothetical protein